MTKILIKKSEKELELLKVIKEKVQEGVIKFPIEIVESAGSAIYEVGKNDR